MLNPSNPRSTAASPEGKRKKLLGQGLVEGKCIDPVQLEEGLKIQGRTREMLGIILVRLGYVTPEVIARTIAGISGLEYIDLEVVDVEEDAVKALSRPLAERYNVVPLKMENGCLTMACDMPLTPQMIGNLQRVTGKQLRICITTTSRIKGVIKEMYETGSRAVDLSEDAAVIRLADGIIEKAVRDRASDIHFETQKEKLRIRLRVDGLLREVESHPKKVAAPLISRIKVLSGLNIAEKRSPQDGAFTYSSNGSSVDIRVSVLPSIHGEKGVLRLLATDSRHADFEALGLEPDNIDLFKALVQRPHGIVLLASPTGSGKSTTLYATLKHLVSEEVNITTVEDPVEYRVEGVTQVQVDQAMKVTFPTALRSILRQDPDIVMIGEIRDLETAEIALQAALTGHLVLATIHTNDAPGALTRLVDMGCEPFLVSSTVCGIMAQRLVRVSCPHCRKPFVPTPDELRRFGLSSQPQGAVWQRGEGCRQCRHTGYKGRIAICEICRVDRRIQQEVVKKSSSEEVRDVAVSAGMRTLFEDGIIKINKGITTPEEIMRVTLLE
ncbi:MAG: ATPase, T2SS/T4P/T4SS family [Desulfobacteraceae bacterium]|jgi:type IV pilus assembly protein PilB